MDTIFAPATARGRAGLAVIRLSGPLSVMAAEKLAGKLPVPGRALRRLRVGGEVIDEALVLTFAEGASFTGEAVAELHAHGSPAVVARLLRALGEIPGLRPAEAGEFTRRAFENGRLDLSEVEGLVDLIEAETEAQRRAAVRQMTGGLKALADWCRIRLVRAAALLEAGIDFADEEVPEGLEAEVLALVEEVLPRLQRELAGFGAAERVRDGFEVVILGQPNAGKSSLINALSGRDAAITSEIAGTTRDLIEVRMEIDGLAVTFVDTAGLRETGDVLEEIGVARALDRARAADLRLVLLDASGMVPFIDAEDLQGDIWRFGKGDLVTAEVREQSPDRVWISAETGEGLPELVAEIGDRLRQRVAGAGLINRERHVAAVRRAIEALESARFELMERPCRFELAAEHLRAALRALDGLIGKVDVEALLGEIFSSFCIGK